jgi:hypothetical protein
MDAATKNGLAADEAACKLPGQGSTLDFSDPCDSALLSLIQEWAGSSGCYPAPGP